MSPPNENSIIYIEDRSGAETDDTCGMKYYWNRIAEGNGIVPAREELALVIGKETHEDLATIAEMEDISEESIKQAIEHITADLTDEDKLELRKMELLYRRLGWLTAFALYIEPQIRERYEDIGIEKELILDRDPLFVPCQPDRVLKSRLNGVISYLEYKTTATASYRWQQSWPFAIQLHIGIAAVQEELETPVGFGQIMGLMKGYDDTNGHLRHPYVWAWYNHGANKWSADYQRGMDWMPMPVWEYPGGIVEWVKSCGEDVAKQQFPFSAPVFLNERKLTEWCERRLRRQVQIRLNREECLTNLSTRAIVFPRIEKNCRPAFGPACPYLLPCHNAAAELAPLQSGDFINRTPHHDIDIEDLA